MSAGTTPDEPLPPAGEGATDPEQRPATDPEPPAPALEPLPAGPLPEPARDVRIKPTRTSTVWTMVAVGVLLLAAILVFILQNGGKVLMKFLFLEATLPLGVALLFAVVLGALLVLVIGVARVLQLRLAARQLKQDRTAARAAARWRGRRVS